MHRSHVSGADNPPLVAWLKARSKAALTGWLVLLCLGLSFLMFFSLDIAQRSQRQAERTAIAKDLAAQLEARFQDYLDVLTAAERFVTASDQVTFENFSAFTQEFLDAYPGILGLSWNPKILNADRAAFEQRLRDEGNPSFSITERRVIASTGERSMVPSEPRELYYPVAYITPYDRNAAAHGFDTYSPDPISKNARRKMLDQSRDEGRPLATGRVALVQADNQYGMLIYNPVYSQDLNGTDPESRRAHLLGYIGGPFLLSEIVRPVAQQAEADGIRLILRDIEAIPDKQHLYDSQTADHREQKTPDEENSAAPLQTIKIAIAGRRMELSVLSPPSGATVPWIVLAIGVLISAAVGAVSFFILSQSESLISPGKAGKLSDRIALPVLTALVGIALSVVLYLVFENLEKKLRNEALLSEAQDQFATVRKSVERNLEVLDSVKSYFDASELVERADFRIFVRPLLHKYANAQAIAWVPKVEQADREAYEIAARAQGIPDFSIRELKDGKMQTAGHRDTYFPAYFVEPLATNMQAIGFDLTSHARPLTALYASRDSGKVVATGRVTLVHTNPPTANSETGVLVINPVYEYSVTHSNLAERRRHLKGFVLIVLRAGDMISQVLDESQKQSDIVVTDITDPGRPEVIYTSVDDTQERSSGAVTFSEQIQVGGREWLVKISPSLDTYGATVLPLPVFMLIGGLIFTTLLTFSILLLVRRREVVEHLVLERTDALRDTASRLQAVMNTVVDGVITLDEQGLIHSANLSAENIFGIAKSEVINQPVNLLIPELKGKALEELFLRLTKQGKDSDSGVGCELNGLHQDGSLFAMELGVNDMWSDGVRMFVFTVRDISSRKKVESEKARLIEELTLSNEELARFAFICSHDLQEPLRMIRSFSEKLQSHMGRRLDTDEKGKKYFRFITEGAARAQDLIAGVLEYSSIETNTRPNESINLDDLTQSIQANLHESLTGRDAQITFGPLPTIVGNRTQIYQLFQNLIVNGLKYQAPDSRPEVHIEGRDMGDQWHFSVRDNGIGINQRHLSKIFEIFQRLNRQSQYTGTGIGLSICKKVVERHGGRIWVASEPGVGSTFYFLIQKPSPLEVASKNERAVG